MLTYFKERKIARKSAKMKSIPWLDIAKEHTPPEYKFEEDLFIAEYQPGTDDYHICVVASLISPETRMDNLANTIYYDITADSIGELKYKIDTNMCRTLRGRMYGN